MKIGVRQVGEVSVVDINGALRIGEGDLMLKDTIARLLKEGRKRFVLNLERTTYADSAGVGELVACYKRIREENGFMALTKPIGKLSDLMAMTQLDQYFRLFEHETDAVSEVNKSV